MFKIDKFLIFFEKDMGKKIVTKKLIGPKSKF